MLYLSFSIPFSDAADTDSEDNADMGMNTHRSFIPPTHRWIKHLSDSPL